jgi:hypothetical protein
MELNSSTSRESTPSLEFDGNDDRGRLLTRIPRIVRSPGRPCTLRHTGPSIHIWLQNHNASPERRSRCNFSFEVSSRAPDSRSDQHGKDGEMSPVSQFSFSTEYLDDSDFLEHRLPSASRQHATRHLIGGVNNTGEHLLPSDGGVTVTRILTISQHGSSDPFVQDHDTTRTSTLATNKQLPLGTAIARRPSPVTTGMRYAALWEWVCSDSVLTTRMQHTSHGIPKLPGRFVEYENFASHYALPSSMGVGSNAACGIRTEQET